MCLQLWIASVTIDGEHFPVKVLSSQPSPFLFVALQTDTFWPTNEQFETLSKKGCVYFLKLLYAVPDQRLTFCVSC